MSRADRSLRRLLLCERGSVAVESVFIIPIFFAMVFSLFEAGYFFYRNALIDSAADGAARLVMTGNAPLPGSVGVTSTCSTGRECFYERICEDLGAIGGCDGKLSVEVRSFETIAEVVAYDTPMRCANDPGYKPDEMEYDTGGRYDYVLVRVCYLLGTLNPGLGMSLARNADGTRSVVATHVRRNEPYVDFNDDATQTSSGGGGKGGE